MMCKLAELLTLLAGFPVASGGNGAGGAQSEQIIIDRANRRLYVGNRGSNTVSAYSINATTGALTALPFTPLASIANIRSLAVHPSGSPLLVSGDAVASYNITATTATAAGSPISNGSVTSFSSVFSRSGSYYYTGGNSDNNFAGFSVNAANGVLTALAGSPFASGAFLPSGYATDSQGRFFAANDPPQVRAFTTANGIPSAVSGNPFVSGLTGAVDGVLSPNENFYYVADRSGNRVGAYQIAGSGAATTLTAVAGSPVASGGSLTGALVFNQSGNFLFAANGNSRNITTYNANPTTGVITVNNTGVANTLGAAGRLTGIDYLPTTPVIQSPPLCTNFSENFDSVTAPALPAGWVATNAQGPAPLWVTSTTTPDTAPNYAVVDDPAVVSDKYLDTPGIFISSASAQVSFRNFYSLEGNGPNLFDGAVLEVSSPNINGGAFTDITNAAVGGSFVSGGYVGTIATEYGNPLAGRAAWSGGSNGYINTVANLGPNVAGQTIKLRFRMASDTSIASMGWQIDSLVVTTTDCPLQSAVSRKVQGGAGTFDINLPFAATSIPGIESRSGGATNDYQVVFTFASPVTFADASLTTGAGSVSSSSGSGTNTVTVNLTGITNAQRIKVTLAGVNNGSRTGDVGVPMGVLVGDTTGNGTVNASDVSLTKAQAGQTVTVSNFREDVNANGAINASDISLVKSLAGTSLPPVADP